MTTSDESHDASDAGAHLAAAAHELIAAGRSMLDQLERSLDRPDAVDDTIRRWISVGQSAVDGFVAGVTSPPPSAESASAPAADGTNGPDDDVDRITIVDHRTPDAGGDST